MANILRVRARFDFSGGGPGLSTFYFLPPPPATVFIQADVDAAFARVRQFLFTTGNSWANAVQPTLLSQADVLNDADGEIVASFLGNVGAPISASTGGAPYAPAIAGLINWKTLGIVHGHALKGRMFVSPLAAATITNGVLGAATISSWTTDATAFVDAAGSGPKLCVWSRPVKVATQNTPTRSGQSWAVTTVTVPAKLAVLRSRRD